MSNEFNFNDPFNIYELKLPNGSRRKIDAEEIKNLSLNPKWHLPDLQGKKTILSNYVLTFWSRILGATTFMVYLQLVKMAFGDKDHAWPSNNYLADLTGLDRRTVQRKMLELIDYGLVAIIHVKDARTFESKNNIYMMPTVIPLISKRQYQELPKRLQKEHDDYMEYIQSKKIMFVPDYKEDAEQEE